MSVQYRKAGGNEIALLELLQGKFAPKHVDSVGEGLVMPLLGVHHVPVPDFDDLLQLPLRLKVLPHNLL